MKKFKKEFHDTITNTVILFDENGITYKKERDKSSPTRGTIYHAFIPYKHISNIEIMFKVLLEISFYEGEGIKKISYGDNEKRSFELKSAVRFAKKQKAKSTYTGEVIIYDEDSNRFINKTHHIMHCLDCDHVYHFTDNDLNKNRQKIKESKGSLVGAVAAGMSGNYILSTMNSQGAQNKLNSIIDYYSCPKCRSKNIIRLTESEFEQLKEKQNSRAEAAQLSNADELKKFKELLDSGIITQEEFDQKKKQLLGL